MEPHSSAPSLALSSSVYLVFLVHGSNGKRLSWLDTTCTALRAPGFKYVKNPGFKLLSVKNPGQSYLTHFENTTQSSTQGVQRIAITPGLE